MLKVKQADTYLGISNTQGRGRDTGRNKNVTKREKRKTKDYSKENEFYSKCSIFHTKWGIQGFFRIQLF